MSAPLPAFFISGLYFRFFISTTWLSAEDLRSHTVLGLGCFLQRVEGIISGADPTSLPCCRCPIRSCPLRMSPCTTLLEYREGEGPGSVLFQSIGSKMLPVAPVRTAIGTGPHLGTEILRRPSQALITHTTRSTLTSTAQEGAQENLPLQVLGTITLLPHITLLRGINLTS